MEENRALPNLPGLWRKISPEARLGFLSGMGIGFVVHLFVFSNLLINHDGAVSLRTANEHIGSGRWSLGFFSQFSWSYEMPVVIALLTITALACTAGLTVAVLGLRSRICIVLAAGFLAAFPSVCCVFPYLYTADAYFFALLLNACAVYAGKRLRFGWVLSAVFIALGAGIYQSFLCYAAGLFLLDCMVLLLEGEKIRPLLFRGLKYIAAIAGGLALYRAALQALLTAGGQSLSGYRNMDQALNSGVWDYLRALPETYRSFWKFFWNASFLTPEMQGAQRALLGLAAACGLFLLIKRKICRQPARLALACLGAGLVPAALNLICIIAAGQTETNLLMEYAFVLVFVFILRLLEMTARELSSLRIPEEKEIGRKGVLLKTDWLRKLPAALCLALCAALLWNDFCLTNAAYLRVQLNYESSYALANRILTRLEAMEEYTPDTPIVLAGFCKDTESGRVPFPQLEEFPGIHTSLVNQYCGTPFLRSFLGGSKRCATLEQRRKIMESGVLEEMAVYPAKNSIRVYEGVILVKLDDKWDLIHYSG